MTIDRKALLRQLDWPLWILGLVVVLSLAGFGVYYYFDRYVHPDQKILDVQAQHMEEMVQKNPQDASLRVTLAAYYADSGLLDNAIEQANQGLKIDPVNQGALLVLGNVYQKKGDLATALANYNHFLDLNKDNPMANMDTRVEGAYYEVGNIYLEQKKLSEATDALNKALAIDHADADALYALGRVYQLQKNDTAAVKQFEQALAFDPTYSEPYRALVTSYTALGKTQEAAYANAMVTLTQGKYSDAASQLEAVLKQAPQLTRAYYGLGVAYEKLGRFKDAYTAMGNYLKSYPDDVAGDEVMTLIKSEYKP
ncbi:MAG: tetratricopeptide repeat protein [Anaerolineae bacterium]